jgi:Ni/Fe-hydrogenase 1 B-type cytochrome subunit
MSAAPRIASGQPRRPIYVWELPVRVTHWLIFFSILVLAPTGYYLGHPFIEVSGRARDHFVMGTVRVVHLYAAIVFTLAVFLRIYWMFAGNRYARLGQFVPVSSERRRSLREAVRFYALLRRDPLPYPGHSALAGAAYGLVFLVYLLMIATGLTLYTVYAPVDSPFQFFGCLIPVFGGLQIARLLHHIGMWLLLIFVIHHVYSVILFSISERSAIFDSMVSGYKSAEDSQHAGEDQ